MKVLIACERSGRVRDAFIARGLASDRCRSSRHHVPGPHKWKDVLKVLDDGWDLMIAHPPCTHLSCSGAKHFKKMDKRLAQIDALQFFRDLLDAPIEKIAVENPVGIVSTKIRKPDQIIQPYWFGNPFRKTTCLWLKNLPNLTPTEMVDPRLKTYSNGKTFSADADRGATGLLRQMRRSITYRGIANAMAE